MENFKQLSLFMSEDERSEYPVLDLLDHPRSLDEFQDSYYSPYPNSKLQEFILTNLSQNPGDYKAGPLPEDLVAGKNTYVYDAHTYHTKVPPQAIMHLIEHYTEPGEIVLDPFCGSGMTGVAAIRTGRKPILIDLSPAATFIAMNFLTPVDNHKYLEIVEKILLALRNEEIKLYGTHCRICNKLIPMEYMVWSYGLICDFCQTEFRLWDVARDEREDVRESKIKKAFNCPACGKYLEKRKLQRTKPYPVQVGYRCCDSGLQESKAVPDEYDLNIIQSVNEAGIPAELWYPTAKFPPGVNTRQAIAHGLTSVDALYTRRGLHTVARLWNIARKWPDKEMSLELMFTVTSLYQRVTQLSEFRFWGGSSNIANYNVPMIFNEQNVFKVYHRKAKTIEKYLATWDGKPIMPFCISTQSATNLASIPDNVIDYIFTDPPFGSNINYSEMNYLWEAWLGVFTNIENEAIINKTQGKAIDDYTGLMTRAFGEMRRVLMPNRWLTVMFHNSSSKVWSALQTSLLSSGFEVERTQMLDKQHGTFKQFVSENAVGYDLLLHCRKKIRAGSNLQVASPRTTSYKALSEFVERTLKQKPEDFIVRYLHVNRKNEIDSRKLYSLWLKERLETQQIVDLDYERFRKILHQVIQLEFGNAFTLEQE